MKTFRFGLIAAAAALFGTEAFAYIDPGTGSLLIQWAFGAAVAGFAVLNVYWARLKAFFSPRSQRAASDPSVDKASNEAGRGK